MDGSVAKDGGARAALALLQPFFRRYRWRLALGLAALLAVDFLQLIVPRFIKRAVDGLAAGTATEAALLRYAGAILLLAALVACCRFVWRYCILGFSRLLERDIRAWLFSHLLTLDRVFFQRHPVGATMALATNDLTAVQLAGGMGLVAFVDAVVMTSAALGFMFYIHPQLTLLTLLPMPVLAVLTKVLSARLHRRFQRVQEQFSRLTEFARASFSFIRLCKAYTQERQQVSRFDRLGQEYVRDNLRLAVVQGALFPVSGLVANLSLLLVVFYGGRLTILGQITAGDFVAFISYLFMLTWPMMALGWVFNLFQRGVTSLTRIREVLEAQPVLPATVAAAPLPPIRRIALRKLSFRYPGQQQPALAQVDLTLEQGITGVIGRTGSGKSTLCHLLARLYPVEDGMLLVDGQEVNTLPVAALRGQIAYVPQEVTLFADTIAANIAFGRPEACQAEIERVAQAAAIHEEILAMPAGYQSRIGEKGVKLSGGQRQRLALARALLLDRPLLIIDDGLSAVDMATEQRIIAGLTSYLTGRLCLIVSHRLAPLESASRILVFDDGRLIDSGSHAELLARNRFYATIHTFQRLAESGEEAGGAG